MPSAHIGLPFRPTAVELAPRRRTRHPRGLRLLRHGLLHHRFLNFRLRHRRRPQSRFPAPERDAGPRAQNAHQDREYILTRLWADADTQAGIRGTAWAGYQAVAEYIDHHSPVRTRGDKATARAARLLITTEPTRLKSRAWQLSSGA
jgi:hypothetical protein